MIYKINLTYFKSSGKYYTSGEYFTEKPFMFEVFEEVKEMLKKEIAPGLIKYDTDFTVLIESDQHPNAYPGLIYGQRD